jgi:ribosomal protein S1
MRVGDRIVCRVTGSWENRVALDFEGMPGQLNVPDLTWNEVRRPQWPQDFPAEGDDVEIMVMATNSERFSASIKHLLPDPYADPGLRVGLRVEGVVANVLDWGTWVHLDNELAALLDSHQHPGAAGMRGTFELTSVDVELRRLRVTRIG